MGLLKMQRRGLYFRYMDNEGVYAVGTFPELEYAVVGTLYVSMHMAGGG